MCMKTLSMAFLRGKNIYRQGKQGSNFESVCERYYTAIVNQVKKLNYIQTVLNYYDILLYFVENLC